MFREIVNGVNGEFGVEAGISICFGVLCRFQSKIPQIIGGFLQLILLFVTYQSRIKNVQFRLPLIQAG